MNLLCSKITQETFLDYEFDSFTIYNFSIKNDKSEAIHIKGKTYLFASYAAYGHSLMDVYAQYKILKLKYPDLKPVFYEDGEKGYKINPRVANDLMDILEYSKDSVINLLDGNYFFDEVVMFFDMNNTFPEKFYLDNGLKRSSHYFPFCHCYMGTEKCGTSKYFAYNYLAIDILKNDFKHLFSKNNKEKIFISRERYNNQYKNEIDYYTNKDNLTDQESQIYGRAKMRYYDKEKYIEEVLKEKGYKIIYAEDHTLREQIEIFSRSSVVSTISGTSLFNVFWCDPDTIAYEIMAVPGYRYHYKEFIDHAGPKHKYLEVFDMNLNDLLNKIKLEMP
jgi:hypothetical protein